MRNASSPPQSKAGSSMTALLSRGRPVAASISPVASRQ
jgi:hypothetical protein